MNRLIPSRLPALRSAAVAVATLAGAAVATAQPAPAGAPADPTPAALAAATTDTVAAPAAASTTPPATDSLRATARRLPRWLAVNGYVTQAAGRSSGGQVSGVSGDGTAALTRAALLARVQATVADRFVLQLAHRRLGASPLAQYQPDIRLDWLFYERAFGDATRVRAGRIPLPLGIYNETRNVGTLMPFYAAPISIYSERSFSSESFDGAMLTHELFGGADGFSLEVSAYAGTLRLVEAASVPDFPPIPAGMDTAAAIAAMQEAAAAGIVLPGMENLGWRFVSAAGRARGAYGATLWANTPIPGLRVGAGTARGRYASNLAPGMPAEPARLVYASVDGTFDRLIARAEWVHMQVPRAQARGGYVQLGGRVSERLSLYTQLDYLRFRMASLPVPPTFQPRPVSYDQSRDLALSAVWALRPNLQLRAEGHLSRDFSAEEGLDVTAPAPRGRRAIFSVSAAF